MTFSACVTKLTRTFFVLSVLTTIILLDCKLPWPKMERMGIINWKNVNGTFAFEYVPDPEHEVHWPGLFPPKDKPDIKAEGIVTTL